MTNDPSGFDALDEAGRARRLRPLAQAALDAWDLDVRRVRLVTNGYNAIFRIDTDGGPFALRVCLPRRTDAELRAELAWLEALDRAGTVAVPAPVPTASGAPWAVADAPGVPGTRRCVLFTWIAGRDLEPADDPVLYSRVGEAAAHLHEHAGGWRPPRGLTRLSDPFPYPDEPAILFDEAMAPRARGIYERALVVTEAALRQVAAARATVVHHDLHPDNVRVRRGRVRVIDFDDCVLATPAQDLGTSAFQMRMRGCDRPQLRAFRRGYERVRPWPDDDLVRAFTAGAALALANGVFQDFDPGYRGEAARLASRWARIADEALRDR
jgi:Ser/Thr protein kinase RdoA (MazF antagonist)